MMGGPSTSAAILVGAVSEALPSSASKGLEDLNKNQLMLVRALPGLVEAHPGIHVDLAGPVQDEPYAEQIRRFVAKE